MKIPLLKGIRKIRLFFSAVSLGLVIGLVSQAREIVEEWKTVRHPSLIMFVPANWEVELSPDTSALTAITPTTDAEDPFQENLFLNVSEIDPSENLSQFADRLGESLKKEEEEFVILSRGPARIGNHSGLQIEATYQSGEESRHLEIFLIRRENRVYSLVIRGENAGLGGFEPVFDQIIATLYPFPQLLGNVYFHDFFLIHLPESWSVKEGLPGTHVAGISPKSNPDDPFRERITVGSQPIKDKSQFNKSVEDTFKNLLTQLPRARERKRSTYPILGIDAPTLELSHGAHGKQTILRVTMLPYNGRVFVLICSGREPDYSRMQPIFEKILNSFASVSPPAKDAANP